MSKLIDEIIRDAMERGEFDNLRGSGKPLDHTEYFSTPEEWRIGYSMLKSGGYIPEEVTLLREIEELKARRAASDDDDEKKSLLRAINDRTLKLNLLLEMFRRKKRF